MNPTVIFLALLTYCALREVYFIYSTQTLMNKLMSRNYHEFQMSEKAGKIERPTPKFIQDDSEPEDLNYLSNIV